MVDEYGELIGVISVEDVAQPAGPAGVARWTCGSASGPHWKRLAWLFAILGPGIITANVDNDAGGISTYSLAGARYGYTLLWMLVPITVALIVVQEMCARMGVVTGKGLADLIREHFGVRITFLIMMAVLVTNFGNTVAEFAGVASSIEMFGVSRYVSVPLGAVFVWWLVVYGSYKSVEKVFLVACLVYVAYPFSGFLAHPDWKAALEGSFVPRMPLDLPARLDGGRDRRHHHRALDAVLPAVRGGGEGVQDLRLRRRAAGRDGRLHHDRRGGLLHRRGLRRDPRTARASTRSTPARTPRGALAPLAGRYASWLFAVGPRQRLALRRLHPAAGHRLLRLRGPGPGGGGRPLVRRGARSSTGSTRR